jgi:hypothetical protein
VSTITTQQTSTFFLLSIDSFGVVVGKNGFAVIFFSLSALLLGWV